MTEDLYFEKVIEPGDRFSELAFSANQDTYGNSPAVHVFAAPGGDFRGGVGTVFADHILDQMKIREETEYGLKRRMWETQETDGGGHKPEYCSFLAVPEFYRGLPNDIVVMNDHDILRRGGLPISFTNFMDIKQITAENYPLAQSMVKGWKAAMDEGNYVSQTGESAVMRYGVTAFCDNNDPHQLILNWAANCTGVHHIERYVTGLDVKPDMWIVGFWEPGMRANGSTWFIDLSFLVWRTIEEMMASSEACQFFGKLAVPSASYAKTILRLHGWNYDGTLSEKMVDLKGLYHITGGGIWGKLKLPPGVGAHLNNMMDPARVLLRGQEMACDTQLHLSDWKAHRTLHGGVGFIVIVSSKEEANIVIDEADKDGHSADIIGKTTADPDGIIQIESRFMERKTLFSNKPE